MRRGLVVAALLLASCGGAPTVPAPIAVSPVLPVSLTSGSYTLTITPSLAGSSTCNGGFCTSISLCTGVPDTTPARFTAQVVRTGDDAVITTDGQPKLTLVLHVQTVPATGSISGSAADSRGLTVDASGTLSGQGSTTPSVASGNIDGQVSLGGAGCANNGHAWMVTPIG